MAEDEGPGRPYSLLVNCSESLINTEADRPNDS
jgi:hypothetical protein